MRRAVLIGLAASVLAFGGAVRAQPAAPPASGAGASARDVIVQGKRPSPPESLPGAARTYVQSEARASPIGTLSRWMSPICPKVYGLEPRFAEFVAQRIRQVAAQAGAPHGDCVEANVEVVFRDDPQAFMDEVRRKYPDTLGYHHAPEEKALAAFQEPIDAWHMTGTRDASGRTFRDDPYYSGDPWALKSPSRGEWPSKRIRQRWNTGRLTVGTGASEFTFALVVVDSRQVGHEPLGRVADHIALLALTNPRRPRTCSPLPTLLDSLDPACPASASLVSLSPYDKAFLEGLYATRAEDPIAFERSDIAHRLEKAGAPEVGPK